MLKSLKRTAKDYDWFGHPIGLTFNNKGDAHQTVCGGLSSVVPRIILTWFLATKLIILYQRRAPDIGSERSKIHLLDFGPQQLDRDDGGVLFYFGLQNQFTGQGYTLDYVS